jgi:hypothetical protein
VGVTPNDFSFLTQLEQRLLDFQKRYEQTASPFKWTFTRDDLGHLLAKLQRKAIALANSAANTLVANLPGNCATEVAAPTAAA